MPKINPYESPKSENDSAHPVSWLTRFTVILLSLQAGTALIAALSNGYEIALLSGDGIIPETVARTQDSRQRFLALIEIIFQLMAFIVFLIWLYRTNKKARELKAEGMQYTPGWSVGWFFVPIANLGMPYFVIKELWQASSPDHIEDWRKASAPPLLRVWCVIWILGMVTQYSPLSVLFGQRRLADEAVFGTLWLDILRGFFWGRTAVNIIELAFSLLTIVLVVSITHLHKRRSAVINEFSKLQEGSLPLPEISA